MEQLGTKMDKKIKQNPADESLSEVPIVLEHSSRAEKKAPS